ncbi:MAG: DUF1835 domain-containing protein [Chitinophagaceae bacterium]|nr:DUF1835 domain-containing protein [Chitinophagaceae bacterium]MBK7679439.1 DUF1835 domain-containing protein [Chitinophagaceae bacterium]MBK8299213.1 DUF1835 domain-containing protein [Chitinophagaceae bacterium]MBK9463265.1 DUF1835 domain-containing protein [Chitinophagaceae bacterium]MBK9659609.1 DUF1835 domain-containing protein [Chitinophagaceae bacterium]
MIHIVFNESEMDLMKQVIEMDETLAGDIIQIKDDFAVGPLAGIETEEGWQARLQWWRLVSEGSPYSSDLVGSFDDRETVKQIKAKLDENPEEQLWIWMGQNQHDVTGYYWLMPQFREYQGRVMILYLNNLPFINEKGQIFYPSWLHEIQPKEFIKAKKLSRPITLSEFEIDPDEWRKIAEENAVVRILEGGKKIAGKEDSFYDSEILKNVTGEWQKATRVLSNTLHRMKIKTGDIFVMWRMKDLVSRGKIEVTGDINKGWKDFDVKLAGGKTEQVQLTQEAEQ